MSVEEILDLVESLTPEEIDAVKANSSRSGKFIQKLGKWIVPQTKHYSWVKALDICGVGLNQMVAIPVKTNYRMDTEALEKTIRQLAAEKTPILGVVAVVGTTEEGQVDEVDKVVEIRERLKKEGIYFYLHVDAAYGGYGRALFIDEDGTFVDYDKLDDLMKKHNVFNYPVTITEEVYNGYKAIKDAESVTVDPHKMGYIPYTAGGIALKYKNMRNIISYFAPYVFEKSVKAPDVLGAYILEGSKAGATAAVWVAHRILPLNITGYGRLMASSIEAARRFRDFLGNLEFNIKGKTIKVYPLNHPGFNMVDWVFKEDGNNDLAAINKLNEEMFDYSSYMEGDVYNNNFITSHTTFPYDDYGDSPMDFVERMGVSEDEWNKVHEVTLLRAAIMSPYLNSDRVFDYYAKEIKKAMEQKLKMIL